MTVICFLFVVFNATTRSQAPPTIEQRLQARGVSPSSLEGLRQALNDTRPEVREMAAALLAERNDRSSLPAIQQAAAQSSSALERFNFAEALRRFGDSDGDLALQHVCQDRDAGQDIRIIAADRLAEVGDSACLKSILEILESSSTPSIQGASMRVLLKYKELSSLPSAGGLQSALETSLRSVVPGNRSLAAECIAHFKLLKLQLPLQIALEKEQDQQAKDDLQSAFSSLSAQSH
jgi:HEAT repeat protein